TYVKLKKGTSAIAAGSKITDAYLAAIGEPSARLEAEFYLQPLHRIHLYSSHIQSLFERGNIKYVQIFSLIAFFILMIACINFMNLSTARSAKRSKEVGLRKVVGAHRHHLIRQFIGESVLITTLALLLALMLVEFLLPVFNKLAGKNLELNFFNLNFVLGLLGILLVTGIVAGSYPAIYLSRFQPAQVLKGKIRTGAGGVRFRKVLVVFQFTLSIILIISTLVVYSQLEYIRNKQLGYDKENTVFISAKGDLKNSYDAVKNKLLKLPLVDEVTSASHIHTNLNNATTGLAWEGLEEENKILFYTYSVAPDYFETLGIELLEGRTFNNTPADTNNIIINQEAARKMGLANPVGVQADFWDRKGKIIGVVKNYHFKPMHDQIEPLVLTYDPNRNDYIIVKTKTDDVATNLSQLEKLFYRLNPDYPFEYQLLEESLDSLYEAEKRMSRIFDYFASLAIFISCLGLFGLASFTVEQRTKEIGVRKVLGASVFRIFLLISKDFTKLVVIAFLLAVPVAYVAMNQWLHGFAYSTNIGISVFVVAGALALLIALLTVSCQTIKTARANPVKSLRYE
ncbi:MAG: FtsX-like permease family protein, partial [Hymenobacteraceae bacterium]|nr:FtsX-like permease family protein [Hymenobacteraceae bacterium]MDX5394962.1 FtsX-like permease family protein [Hymenobacteraceae bacterium]MDX5510996.1 FtsX-like permease family protein [Hymenobacteraceae bacterium]